jgi:hypothetical protein
MKRNVGTYDAAIRTMLGLGILFFGHHLRTWWALVGFIPILSAMLGVCPIYWLFGFESCSWDEADDHHGPPSRLRNV